MDRSPNAADEHQAHDAGLELVCAGDDGLVVVCTGLGDVVAGTGLGLVVLGLEDALPGTVLGGELGDRVDDEEESGGGLGDDAVPDCAVQWNRTDLAGHSGAAATDTRVSFPDVRQAVTLTCGPDAADTLAKSTAAGPRVPASAYPPAAAAASTHSVAARGASFLGFL